jgi:hypothetical protein
VPELLIEIPESSTVGSLKVSIIGYDNFDWCIFLILLGWLYRHTCCQDIATLLACIYFYVHVCVYPCSMLPNPLMGYVIAICHVNGRSLSSILGL